jgi:hypothetical protein
MFWLPKCPGKIRDGSVPGYRVPITLTVLPDQDPGPVIFISRSGSVRNIYGSGTPASYQVPYCIGALR